MTNINMTKLVILPILQTVSKLLREVIQYKVKLMTSCNNAMQSRIILSQSKRRKYHPKIISKFCESSMKLRHNNMQNSGLVSYYSCIIYHIKCTFSIIIFIIKSLLNVVSATEPSKYLHVFRKFLV